MSPLTTYPSFFYPILVHVYAAALQNVFFLKNKNSVPHAVKPIYTAPVYYFCTLPSPHTSWA